MTDLKLICSRMVTMLQVIYVLMVLAPTTQTPSSWHPFIASASKEDCESEAKMNLEKWDGKSPEGWKCVQYKLAAR